jgi:hypothetical protein
MNTWKLIVYILAFVLAVVTAINARFSKRASDGVFTIVGIITIAMLLGIANGLPQ